LFTPFTVLFRLDRGKVNGRFNRQLHLLYYKVVLLLFGLICELQLRHFDDNAGQAM